MTPNGNFDALLKILDDREQERLREAARREQAWQAERTALVTAALTIGVLLGLAGAALTIGVWWVIR